MSVLGVWMWPESLKNHGAESAVTRCARMGVTDLFFLTKGLAGTVSYASEIVSCEPGADLLRDLLDCAHRRGIRVHAWLTSASDEHYKALHPESGSWLREMLTLVIRKNIGAVGAREVFSDGTVRHGGLVTGMGARKLVGRSQLGEPAVSGGYFGQLAILRDVSAVSSECLMIRRDRFEEAGGFSEGYQDTLFDADLCLKLLEKGYRNVVTPFAEMKGGSRKHFSLDYGAEKASYEADGQCFRQTWQHRLERPDPCYNPNLTLEDADYSIRIC